MPTCSHGKTTLLQQLSERRLAVPPHIDILLCEQGKLSLSWTTSTMWSLWQPPQCGCHGPPPQCGCHGPPQHCGCHGPPPQCGRYGNFHNVVVMDHLNTVVVMDHLNTVVVMATSTIWLSWTTSPFYENV